jgi:phage tail sheath protein FI
MPVTPTYPGVYIEELSSGVRTIVGVATSITAFVGRTQRGPLNEPTLVNSLGDFERLFGGLWDGSKLPYAVRDFFLNGGSQALIVRIFHDNADQVNNPSTVSFTYDGLSLEAAYPGAWGKGLRLALGIEASASVAQQLGLAREQLFSLTVIDSSPGGRSEQFNNLTLENGPRRIDTVLADESKLLRWKGTYAKPGGALAGVGTAWSQAKALEQAQADFKKTPSDANKKRVEDAKAALATALDGLRDPVWLKEVALAAALKADPAGTRPAVQTARDALKAALDAVKASDGDPLTFNDFIGPGSETANEGIYALAKADLFNLLCIPPYKDGDDDAVEPEVIAAAAALCEMRRAMLLIDPPKAWHDKDAAKTKAAALGTRSKNAAFFFPRLRQRDPLADNQWDEFAPCGAVAGIMARTDANRGVWKAPAGLEATLVGVPELSVKLTDMENGELNPLGINCLRSFPAAGRVVWGSRTRQGDDRLTSEWKYIPVRRLALYIEESLYRGTQWAVFEPNDEPLWAQIRLNLGAFMNGLFRQGAFQGRTPREAYLVKCDRETTTQDDINRGVVNIVVGFAPLKPAEFVIIQIQQLAGQIAV